MKWLIGLLLVLVAVGLLLLKPSQSGEKELGTESSRRVLDAAWRATPEGEMTIAEMERYAVGLSDEELWRELEEVCGDWMAENEGLRNFRPPRLAVMLAREVGRRGGETGLMEVASWLEDLEEFHEDLEDYSSERQRRLFSLSVQTAAFGGWVSSEPDEAITRLIESRRNDEAWPVPNEGFLMYFKVEEFFAMERVLRDGFLRLAEQDLGRAQQLLIEGTFSWAFDVNEVFESVFKVMTKEDREVFFDTSLSSDHFPMGEWGVDLTGEFENRSYRSVVRELVDVEFWTSDRYGDLIVSNPELVWLERIDRWVRVRPDEATRILSERQVSNDLSARIFAFLAADEPSRYDLLSMVPEASRQQALGFLMEAASVLDFGPIDGRESRWEIDYEKLLLDVGDLEIDPEQRRELLDDVLQFQERD